MGAERKHLRSDIIALRAIAVLLVLASHFQIPHFGFGFVGVDIFFVLSGYLITRVLYKEYLFSSEEKGVPYFISLVNFYLRRARRLLPAAIVVIGIVNLASFFISNSVEQDELAQESKWAVFLLANIAFLRNESDYFQNESEPSMLLHYWSLSVEEQFYIFWPLLFVFASAFIKIKFRGKFFRFNKRILLLILLCTILSFSFLQLDFEQNPNGVYFSIFTRAWELGVGGLFGILAFHKDVQKIYSKIESYFPFIVVLLLTALVINTSNWARIIPFLVLAVAWHLFAGEGPIEEKKSVPGRLNRFMLFIGTISYSLYLIHWPVYVISVRYEFNDHLWQRILLFPISILLAYFLWRFVESPFQRIKLPATSGTETRSFILFRKRPLSVALISVLILGGLYQLTYSESLPKLTLKGENSAQIDASPNMLYYANYFDTLKMNLDSDQNPEVLGKSPGINSLTPTEREAWQTQQTLLLREALKASKLNSNEISAFKTLKDDQSPFENSDCPSADQEAAPNCAVGDTNASKRVALIGDSKMAHLAQPLMEYFDAKGWRVEPMVLVGCRLSNPTSEFRICPARSKWTLQAIVNGNYDVVISAEYPDGTGGKEKSAYFSKIIESTKKLVIFQEIIALPYATECISADFSFTANCFQRKPLEIAGFENARKFEKNLDSAKVVLIDQEPWVCVNGQCPLTIDNTFIYRDGRHYTYSFVKRITPYINSLLDKFIS